MQGLELGEAYRVAATVEVGGDVYDFMELATAGLRSRLGDVTGQGIEAAADMAMAKFVFRSLARGMTEPGDFLQSANEVVVARSPRQFITLVTFSSTAATAKWPRPARDIHRPDMGTDGS